MSTNLREVAALGAWALMLGACTPGTLGRDRDGGPGGGPGGGPPACANGADDDGDGLVDGLDPGCADGTDGDEVLRTFTDTWTETSSITVLFVVDDSGSMCEEQRNLRLSAGFFLDALRATAPAAPFHIGVVTTDTSNTAVAGRLQNQPVTVTATALCPTPPPPLDCTTGLPTPLPKWVDENTPEPERLLACLLQRGITGFGGETALGAARMALSPVLLNDPSANQGFYTPGSALLVVFVGDEDDCSVCSGTTCAPLPGLQFNLDCSINRVNELTPISDFVSYVNNLPDGDGSTLAETGVLTAAFIGLDAAGNSDGPTIADPGGADGLVPICSFPGQGSAAPAPRIEGFVRSFDEHEEYNLCDGDFADELAELGGRVGDLLTQGCLPTAPCDGITVEDVTVTAATATGAGTTVPPWKYTIGPDPTCGSGWSVRVTADVAVVSITYPAGPGACP